jgi:hypothetical protein
MSMRLLHVGFWPSPTFWGAAPFHFLVSLKHKAASGERRRGGLLEGGHVSFVLPRLRRAAKMCPFWRRL